MRYPRRKFRTEAPKGGFLKLGFGTSPVRDDEWQPRIEAVQTLMAVLEGKVVPAKEPAFLDALSTAKGLFTRIALGDQNDWFTVSRQLGHPSHAYAKRVSNTIKRLREAVVNERDDLVERAVNDLDSEPLWECLDAYLASTVRAEHRERDEGWAYILWSSSEKDVLAIGAAGGTIGDVEARLNRDYPGNPYGVLAAWLVEDAVAAHEVVRSTFDGEALGDGFFRLDIGVARRTLEAALTERGLVVDSPWHEEAAKPTAAPAPKVAPPLATPTGPR